MTTNRWRGRLVPPLLAVLAASSCATPVTTTPPTVVQSPTDAAMAAYERYWSVTDAAFAAPRAQDWTAQLRDVATGAALTSVTKDVANYAAYPAHQQGTTTRMPKIDSVADGRVDILDCVTLGDSRLVADKTGACPGRPR